MGVYNAPNPPPPSNDPVADATRAFGWLTDFFNNRVIWISITNQVVGDTIKNIPGG